MMSIFLTNCSQYIKIDTNKKAHLVFDDTISRVCLNINGNGQFETPSETTRFLVESKSFEQDKKWVAAVSAPLTEEVAFIVEKDVDGRIEYSGDLVTQLNSQLSDHQQKNKLNKMLSVFSNVIMKVQNRSEKVRSCKVRREAQSYNYDCKNLKYNISPEGLTIWHAAKRSITQLSFSKIKDKTFTEMSVSYPGSDKVAPLKLTVFIDKCSQL